MKETVLYHNGAEIHVFRPQISDAELQKRLRAVKIAMVNMGKELADKGRTNEEKNN